MKSDGEHIPKLWDIAVGCREIPPDIKINQIVGMFQKDSALIALPVVSQGQFCGFITRKTLFFKQLSHKFALELYGNKTVCSLPAEHSLVMDPNLDIHRALKKLLESDPALEIDCFPIVEDGFCRGIVTVSDLMMQISKSQTMLYERVVNLSARLRDEVAMASRIQQELLPVSEFTFNGISICSGIITSSEIGGDFFDYFTFGDNRLGLIIADVSGHGVQAGMVTTAAKASLHTLISMGVTTPSGLLQGMNRAVIATARQTLLMTCLIMLIDVEEKRLSFANAGHNFPYIYRRNVNQLEQLQYCSGFPLGFEPDCCFQEFTIDFNAGDSLFLYTDGLIECMNQHGEDFGYSRLEKLLIEGNNLSPVALKTLLFESVLDFSGSSTVEDDVTAMVVVTQ
ncbi:MAG: SpoIIE family protein phosphatase [Desulfuromonadales bacterium]|nr:SpoIIE family protein phosphatase [Desulfuromonadales bacterium]